MMNIIEEFTYYKINLNLIQFNKIKRYFTDVFDDYDNIMYVSGNEIEKVSNLYENYRWIDSAVDYSSGDTDLLELEGWLRDHIGNYPHYLVFAKSCTWNGNSGYKFCDNILDTLQRSYDATFYYKKKIQNGILIIESSHDVPTGSETIIIGITNKEYNKLEDLEFDEIEKYVQKFIN